jgi:hypothetical protein
MTKIPKVLNEVADVVLRYRPKPKTKVQKSRKRRAKKAQRESKL